MLSSKILIIIPAHNESNNIVRVIADIRQSAFPADILVIDDGSEDATFTAASRGGVMVIRLEVNLGIGGAVQTGLRYAAKNNYDIVVRVDGDGQHDSQYLKDLIKPLVRNETDMVVGSRFVAPLSEFRSSAIRRVGIYFFATVISFLTKFRITDPTSGFCAWNKKCVQIFSQYYPVDFPEPESLIIAKKSGLRVLEIPVKMHKRLLGSSSIRYLRTLYYMIKVTCAILLGMLKRGRG